MNLKPVFTIDYCNENIVFFTNLLRNPAHRGNKDERRIRWIINEFKESIDEEKSRHRESPFSVPEDLRGHKDTEW